MKIFKTFIWVFTSILLLFFSCAKDKIEKNAISDELGIGLTVDIGGISEDFETIAATTNSVKLNNDESPDLSKLVSFNDFDAIPTVTDLKPSPSSKFIKLANNKIASQTPMSNGIKYYLVLFDDDNGARGNFKSSHLLTAGVRKTISVEVGKKYHWKAYSYNSETDDLPAVSGNNFNVSMGENKDFLYASGVTDIISADSPTLLSVIFNRMLTRVGIEINAKGMFTDRIDALDVDLNVQRITATDQETENVVDFNIANFNILDSTISEIDGAPYTKDFKLFLFNTIDNIPKSDKVIAYIHIPVYPNAQYRFSVKLNKLNIKLDQEATSAGYSNREFLYTDSPAPIVFSERLTNFNIGKSKLVRVDLVESPLTIKTTGTGYGGLLDELPIIGDLLGSITGRPKKTFEYETKWARSNLYKYKIESESTSSYRFNHINQPYLYPDANNKYKYFKFLDKDPCAEVYPSGLWKLPDALDFAALTGGRINDEALLGLLSVNIPLVTDLLAILGGTLSIVEFEGLTHNSSPINDGFIEYNITSGYNTFYNEWSGNNKLRFNYNGYIVYTGILEDLIALPLFDTYGDEVKLWGYNPSVGVLGSLVQAGAMIYQADENVNVAPGLDLLNVSVLGLDVLNTNYNTIRCVRNPKYTRKNNN